jgi:hypothetical protein
MVNVLCGSLNWAEMADRVLVCTALGYVIMHRDGTLPPVQVWSQNRSAHSLLWFAKAL